jgi:hypothetical protein
MRVQERLALIDLDSSGAFRDDTGAPRSLGALKFSSGYVAPELVHCDADTGAVCVRSPSDPLFMSLRRAAEEAGTGCGGGPLSFLPASPALDLWSLGVVIYQLSVNAPLLLCDVDGNCDEEGLRQLAGWTEAAKADKLRRVGDRLARHLVSQLLSRDPARRPSAKRVLAHPFLTGRAATRLEGDAAEFDVFISYRVAADSWLAEQLYERLTAAECGLRVWWDKECLEGGMPWEEGFCKGLVKSRVFVPLLSRGACAALDHLGAASPCDNLLLEHRLALELHERGLTERVFPLFLGDLDAAGLRHGRYTFTGPTACHPLDVADVAVEAVEGRLLSILEQEGLGLPLREGVTVKGVLKGICGFQVRPPSLSCSLPPSLSLSLSLRVPGEVLVAL